jgi:Phage integrase, N-terminal SAM-like domain
MQPYEPFKEALKSRKERTQYDYKRVLEKYLQPKFGSKKLADISYEDITKITDRLLGARSETHWLSHVRFFAGVSGCLADTSSIRRLKASRSQRLESGSGY